MSNRRNSLQEDVRLRVFRIIGDNPTISQRGLASRVGISVGAAHHCITAFAEKGLIKIGNVHASRNKRGYAYLLTPEGLSAKAQLTIDFLRRKVTEYEALKDEITELEREVGHEVEQRTSCT